MLKMSDFEQEVKNGYLSKNEDENLVQYTYNEKCEFERYWNPVTRAARGIIFEKSTGKLIAKPFEKFFNLGTTEETFIQNLPNEQYTVYEKCDGSLGIIYFYNNEWRVATKGSLKSDQAKKAQELLNKEIWGNLNTKLTYLVEIIYPENKIVVNYGNTETLVFLSAFNVETGEEITEYPCAFRPNNIYNYTIEQMIELQKTLPKDKEGFVVRFENGFRVKIKGDEYCRIHKILSYLSPLSFWEVMTNEGKVDRFYIEQIPEEYRFEFDPIVSKLEEQYSKVGNEIVEEYKQLPLSPFITKEEKKFKALVIQNSNFKHKPALFHCCNNRDDLFHKYIMNYIRPDANNFKEI